MANQRKKGKKKLQVWLDDLTRAKLIEIANACGHETVTGFLQAVGDGGVRIEIDLPKDLAAEHQRDAARLGITEDALTRQLASAAFQSAVDKFPKKKSTKPRPAKGK